jgi:hypothetical protein
MNFFQWVSLLPCETRCLPGSGFSGQGVYCLPSQTFKIQYYNVESKKRESEYPGTTVTMLKNCYRIARILHICRKNVHEVRIPQSSVRTIGVRYSTRQETLLFSTASRQDLGHNQPTIQWARGVNRQEREAQHKPPSSAEVKNGGVIPPLPRMPLCLLLLFRLLPLWA